MSKLLLGLDGGGSKTLALLAGADGSVLGRGIAGASNYQNIGEIAAWAALGAAIAAAFADAGLEPSDVAAVGLGLAGVDRPEDRALFEGWAAERFGGAPVVIANDAELVLAAGTPDGWASRLSPAPGLSCSAAARVARWRGPGGGDTSWATRGVATPSGSRRCRGNARL